MKRTAITLILALSSLARADYLGSWKINDYVTVQCTTHRFSTGAAYAATGDVHLDIYEDDTDVQIVDDTNMAAFDSVTGLYLVKVQLLAATGFEAGKHYTCVISATVDGVAGILTHQFQILAPVDLQTVETADATDTLGTAQTGDAYAIVNHGTYGNAAIKGYVDDIGVAGAGLTAIPWNAAWDTEVQSEVDDALTAYDVPTEAQMNARTLAAASYLTAATVVDGVVTLDDLWECQLAFLLGKVAITDQGATQLIKFYKRDAATVQYQITPDETTGARSAGGTLDP